MQETYLYMVIIMNSKILKALEILQEKRISIQYKEIADLLNEDVNITYFVNRSVNSIRIYNNKYNCHIYNIFFSELNDKIVIEKIVSL